MTTPNGQHPVDPPAAEAPISAPPATTSNVLPLDGWGPIAEPEAPEPNGINGVRSVEPTAETEPTIPVRDARPTPLGGQIKLPSVDLSLDSQLMRLLAPALVMGAAVWITLKLSSELRDRQWRSPFAGMSNPAPAKSTLSRAVQRRAESALRRRLALAIDPSLAQETKPAPWWRKLLD